MSKAGLTYSKKIAAPDYQEIRTREERAVMDELGSIARPDDRLERAAEIIRQADAEIALHIEDRDKAVASLWFYEKVLGLPRTIGITKNAYREILSKALHGKTWKQTDSGHVELPPVPSNLEAAELAKVAEEAGVPRVESAAENLPKLASVVAAARARRNAAVVFMRNAALALSEEPYGWSAEKIAEHAGVVKKLIYQQQATARRERGH